MRLRLEKQLLILSLLCILSKVYSQLCRRPCYCPHVLPRCPRGTPLVLDGCGCCRVCARRLGEPCDFLHVCDRSQGLVCDYSAGTGGTCNFEDNEEGCEVNGRLYRDGEVFQPSCKLQCRCLDGGFTCVPLCQEDVRLPTPDCPYPRRVEVPGKCCPEWVCEAGERHLLQSAGAAPAVPYPCQPWGTEWSACSATCGVGFSTRVSNQNRSCRLETQRRLCVVRPCPALPAASPAHPMAANAPLRDNGSMAPCPVDAAFAQHFLPGVYLLVTPLGLLGNVLGLWQLHASPRSPLSLLVGHLGLADLLYVCTLPFLVSYYLRGRVWAFGQGWCRLTRGLFHLNLYASIGFLTCISVHRYLGIVHPLRARGRCQAAMSAGRLSAAVWLWVIVQVGPDFAFSKMDPTGIRCHDTTGDESLGAYVPYTAAVTVTGFVIPFLIIIGCYCHVVVVLCRSDTVEPGLRRSSIRLVVLVMVLFSVCFLPYHIFRNLNLLSRAWQQRGSCTQAMKDIYVSYQVTRGLASFNSALNPLLYVMTSKHCMSRMRNIHQRAKETLGSLFTWESSNQAHETRSSTIFREQEASEQL